MNLKWVTEIWRVKLEVAKMKPEYDQKKNILLKLDNGKEIKMRTDCSGFVSACLECAEYLGPKAGVSYNSSSYGPGGGTLKILEKKGWKLYPLTNMGDLIPGDLMVTPGKHIQIYAGPHQGKVYCTWNAGTTRSLQATGFVTATKAMEYYIKAPEN